MVLNKWNYTTKKYEPYEVPDTWNVAIHRDNLWDPIDCAMCGKTILYGVSYSSPAIHTEMGIGYCVCEKCHREEMELRLSFKAKEGY